jgi:16S rRNA (uracil1498-N3)-methyltransferase
MSLTSIRLFVTDHLQMGMPLAIAESQAHYLANVMRLTAGDELRLFNGRDGEWQARIATLSRKALILEPVAMTRAQDAEPDCWLCFALLKRQKTDLVVEKATELGVSVIQPVITARTQADHVNLARLRAITIEAAEQCERLAVPEVREPIPFHRLIADWPAGRVLNMADERRTARLVKPASGASALLVGPEGGFTTAEVDAIASNPLVTRVSLGARILRAETAAIAGLALLLAAGPPQE